MSDLFVAPVVELPAAVSLVDMLHANSAVNKARGVFERDGGSYDEVETLLADVLQRVPAFSPAWRLLAELLTRRRDSSLLERVCAPWLNGERTSLPEYVVVATELLAIDQAEAASNVARAGLQHDASFADLHAMQGDALRLQKRWRAAALAYEECVRLAPQHVRAQTNLSGVLMQCGRVEDAVTAASAALKLDPGLRVAKVNLGRALIEQGKIEQAMDAFADAAGADDAAQATKAVGQDAMLCTNIALGWRAIADLMQATIWLDRALLNDPGYAPARAALAAITRERGDLDAAFAQAQIATTTDPECYEAWSELAQIHLERGDAAAATEAQQRARRLSPELPAAIALHANTLVAVGDMKGALAAYKEALAINDMSVAALCGMGLNFPGKMDRGHRQRIETLLEIPTLRAQTISPLHAAMASYFDVLGDYERAASHTDRANALQWQYRSGLDWRYDPEQFAGECLDLRQAFTADTFSRFTGCGDATEQPVFIVGMPRSGTTLLEQILGAHPQVIGVGERTQATLSWDVVTRGRNAVATVGAMNREMIDTAAALHIERLRAFELRELGAAPVRYFVDKLPDNFRYLGWLALQFPNARVIDLRRDPRDVLISCWMKQFGSLQWSVRPDWIAHRIGQYRAMMQHWDEVLPLRLLRVSYEALAAEPEVTARRIVEFLDLPWDPACLDFHHARRAVRTASVAQVREPVHQRSVARWKHYETHLHEAFSQLPDD